MFVEDIKNDFYNLLLGKRVLLLVHYDVDAICACKILQDLFKCDNISYTLVPVGGISELKTAYEENNEEIKYVVLINCGGTIDLLEILQPDEDVVFFILDSHKPTDIYNVYSDEQVRLVYKDDEENIPNYDDIFKYEEEDEDEEVENGIEGLEALVERRKERKAWQERKQALMINYMQCSYYGKPSACVMLELSALASRLSQAALWAAAVAAESHSVLHARFPQRSLLDAEALYRYVRAAQRSDDSSSNRTACVVMEKDAWLPLYREWTLEAAISHACMLAPKLKLYARSGTSRLLQLLADMGIPLQQARQTYRSMDVELRRSLLKALETAAPKHNLPVPTKTTFILQRPHMAPLASLDTVYVIMALIEHETIPKAEGFQQALAALEITGENDCWRRGSAAAMRYLQAVGNLFHATLSSKKLQLAGPFKYFIVQEGTPEAGVIRGPLWLGEAARWVAGGLTRTLVASTDTGDGSSCLLLGLPPRFKEEPKNFLGAAFQQAALKTGASVSLDYMDTSVVAVPTSQRAQLLDALTVILS